MTARRARDDGISLAPQVLAYPAMDADFEAESYRRCESGLNLTRERMQWYWSIYLAGADPLHPDVSPLRARGDPRGDEIIAALTVARAVATSAS